MPKRIDINEDDPTGGPEATHREMPPILLHYIAFDVENIPL